ncbi:amidohydrolase family protein [Nocardioides panacis]|uniref:amidohydrolase family protein n=1 Tax=Nocardioides panacis TaxID=2849501 RepID=UPI0020B28B6A|nr:amidohydrolase family protein [Nocardioides panacis]
MAEPVVDADVPGWWTALGIPGLFDVHVHFLPPPILRKVREQFDRAGPLIGREWPLEYRGDDDERVGQLRALGVRHFSSLPYAHRPGIAAYLNEWSAQFAAGTPECLSSATFYPEPGAGAYVAELVAAGTQVFKVHVQVGDFDLLDPLIDDAWGTLAEAGTPVVVHASGGPVGNDHTGPAPMRKLMERHPTLTAVIAHMGAPEYTGFLAVAEDFERVRLDTTMAFTDFFEEMAAFPRDLLPRLSDLQDRILLGSDFPNIPYPYAHQLAALERLGLGEDWLRAVCWDNGHRLFSGDDARN